MYKENGVTYKLLVLVIIIFIATVGVIANKVIGKNGVLNRVVEVENSYSKEDVVEKINYIVTQKFIELNNQAKQNSQNIAELYNSDVVIEHLKQSFIIEQAYSDDGNIVEGVYNIDLNKLKEDDIKDKGNYKLEKRDSDYIIVYYDDENNSQDVGELQIQQM